MNASQWETQLQAAHTEALIENDARMADDLRAERVPGGGVHWPHCHLSRWSYDRMDTSPSDGANYGLASEFHWRGGLTFARLKCGCVAISSWLPSWVVGGGGDGYRRWTRELVAIIARGEFASIMASVSARGEITETYQQAVAFLGDAP